MSTVVRLGLQLGAITLVFFFALYFAFSMGFMGSRQYYVSSAIVISFVLPLLYAGVGLYSVYLRAKKEVLGFRQAFRQSFIPMLLGGLLSCSVIFLWFNTAGRVGESVLQTELLNNFEAQIQGDTEVEQLQQDLETMRSTDVNLFGLKYFFQFSLVLQLFYLILSAIFAMFMKNRRF